VEKVRIWFGPKEKYKLIGLSVYGDEGPAELRKLVGAIELTMKMHFPQASIVKAESLEELYAVAP